MSAAIDLQDLLRRHQDFLDEQDRRLESIRLWAKTQLEELEHDSAARLHRD